MDYKHLEVTNCIPCPNKCNYCPQNKLLTAYCGNGVLSMVKFKEALKNVDLDIKLHFSGFSEPFANPDGHRMVRYAIRRGHRVQVYTSGLNFDKRELDGYKYDLFLNKKNSISKPVSRAGNLWDIPKKSGRLKCTKSPTFEQNVMLPNGDVYLCCMDYGLKHKLGNIFETNFKDLKRKKSYELCRTCESSVKL